MPFKKGPGNPAALGAAVGGKRFAKGNDAAKDHLFQKGKSGNPGGQTKEEVRHRAHIRELAQQHGEEAIQALVDEMRNTESTGPSRIAAAIALLDRGYGKPKETVEVHSFSHATEMTEEELEAIARGGSAGDSATPPSTH